MRIKVGVIFGGETVEHEVTGVCGAAKVLIRPAKAGRGIIAGGASRIVLELAGVKDVVAKSLGSSTQINTAKATIKALESQRTFRTGPSQKKEKVYDRDRGYDGSLYAL